MKINTKKAILAAIFSIFSIGCFFVANFRAQAASDNCICSSGGSVPFVYNQDKTLTVASNDECKKSCMQVPDAKYYSYSNVGTIGYSRLYNCLCVNGSVIPFYYPLDSKFDVSGDDTCNQQCANQGTKYYSYSNLLNLGTSPVTKTPNGPGTGQTPPATPASSTSSFDYKLLETFPGFFSAGQSAPKLPELILALYKFGIWTIGIAGLFMLTIGGIMYMGSAGNTSTAGNAKDIIKDSLLGIAAAMGAYLLLYVINPDLTKLNLNLVAVNLQGGSAGPGGSGSGSGPTKPAPGGAGTGKCTPVLSGPCSVENLKNTCFSSVAEQASSICSAESGGLESGYASTTDICKDGNSFSRGLFQINMTCQCKNAFQPVPAKGCANYSCTVSDKSAYDSCVQKFNNPASNIQMACQIYKEGGWGRWGANSKCGF